jgi:hypothetical protein
MFYIDSVMYANTSSDDYWKKAIYSTLAHEFQHMIHFYQKTTLQNTYGEEIWLDEMLSESTEDLVATKLQTEGVRGIVYTDGTAGSIGNYEGRFPEFNNNNTLSLTSWTGQIRDYSKVASFGAYLLRNYGGAKILHDMVHNNFTDEQAVVTAVNQSANGANKTFADLLQEWGVAVLLSSRDDISAVPNYNQGDFLPNTYGASTYQLGSINFFNYDPQPRLFTTAGTVNPYGNYYYKIGDNLTGNVDINLTLNGTTEAILVAK